MENKMRVMAASGKKFPSGPKFMLKMKQKKTFPNGFRVAFPVCITWDHSTLGEFQRNPHKMHIQQLT
jgi:hypothetical protein